ncbi:MAG: hypothetical protein ACN4GG_07290 [Akkermansiaceae bacterium]
MSALIFPPVKKQASLEPHHLLVFAGKFQKEALPVTIRTVFIIEVSHPSSKPHSQENTVHYSSFHVLRAYIIGGLLPTAAQLYSDRCDRSEYHLTLGGIDHRTPIVGE